MFILKTILTLYIVAWARGEIEHTNFQPFFNEVQKINSGKILDSNVGLNISELLTKYNYPLEYHQVETEDGFILTMHRIPYGRNETVIKEGSVKPVVFLAHGLGTSSMDWVFSGPNESLGLLLADQGFDIWLGNTRGNIHSLKHKSLTPENASFWNFSFHEKGVIDTPLFIDYIINVTGVSKINYVGHSQGTTQAMVLTSVKPEYNEKFNLMVLLSPIAFVSHATRSPVVKFASEKMGIIEALLKLFNMYGIYINKQNTENGTSWCSILDKVCSTGLQLVTGFDEEKLDWDKLSVFMANLPSGLSYKEFSHFGQEVISGYFRNFDYGSNENVKRYGLSEPPSYDVSKITAPLALYYGTNDYLGTVEDIENLVTQLTDAEIVDKYLIENFNHLDFLIARDISDLLYTRVIDLINKRN